jgi:hypothetical protein
VTPSVWSVARSDLRRARQLRHLCRCARKKAKGSVDPPPPARARNSGMNLQRAAPPSIRATSVRKARLPSVKASVGLRKPADRPTRQLGCRTRSLRWRGGGCPTRTRRSRPGSRGRSAQPIKLLPPRERSSAPAARLSAAARLALGGCEHQAGHDEETRDQPCQSGHLDVSHRASLLRPCRSARCVHARPGRLNGTAPSPPRPSSARARR